MIYFFNDQLLNTSFSHNDICSEYEKGAICHRLVLVCGTSTCHMAVSRRKLFIPGVWGPFWSGKLLEFNNQCFDLKDFETYCCVLRVLLYKCKGCGWTQEQVEISCWNLLNLVTLSIWNFKSWFILQAFWNLHSVVTKPKSILTVFQMYGLNYQEANFFSSIRCFVIEGKM